MCFQVLKQIPIIVAKDWTSFSVVEYYNKKKLCICLMEEKINLVVKLQMRFYWFNCTKLYTIHYIGKIIIQYIWMQIINNNNNKKFVEYCLINDKLLAMEFSNISYYSYYTTNRNTCKLIKVIKKGMDHSLVLSDTRNFDEFFN